MTRLLKSHAKQGGETTRRAWQKAACGCQAPQFSLARQAPCGALPLCMPQCFIRWPDICPRFVVHLQDATDGMPILACKASLASEGCNFQPYCGDASMHASYVAACSSRAALPQALPCRRYAKPRTCLGTLSGLSKRAAAAWRPACPCPAARVAHWPLTHGPVAPHDTVQPRKQPPARRPGRVMTKWLAKNQKNGRRKRATHGGERGHAYEQAPVRSYGGRWPRMQAR